jgi:hypothetical protein
MAEPKPRELTEHEREQMRRWLDIWAHVGPILEAERWARVRALTDEEAWQEAQRLMAWWEPEWKGDEGEGLLMQQDVFRLAVRPADRAR